MTVTETNVPTHLARPTSDDGIPGGTVGSSPHGPSSVWEGETIRLRPVEADDWPAFAAWDHDDASSRASYLINFPRSAEGTRKWVEEAAGQEYRGDRFRWVIARLDGTAAGTINTHACDARNGTFSYGLAIGADHRGHGYAGRAIRLVPRFYFQELRYQKATVYVYGFNEPSQRLHERLGFQVEGRLRRMIYSMGTYHDTLVYGLTAEEFAAGT